MYSIHAICFVIIEVSYNLFYVHDHEFCILQHWFSGYEMHLALLSINILGEYILAIHLYSAARSGEFEGGVKFQSHAYLLISTPKFLQCLCAQSCLNKSPNYFLKHIYVCYYLLRSPTDHM